MRQQFSNTSLDGKYMTLQIRIVSRANREKKRKALNHYDTGSLNDYVHAGNEYEEITWIE